jgi:hypothetical protein
LSFKVRPRTLEQPSCCQTFVGGHHVIWRTGAQQADDRFHTLACPAGFSLFEEQAPEEKLGESRIGIHVDSPAKDLQGPLDLAPFLMDRGQEEMGVEVKRDLREPGFARKTRLFQQALIR